MEKREVCEDWKDHSEKELASKDDKRAFVDNFELQSALAVHCGENHDEIDWLHEVGCGPIE